jgi:hypothetical protein
MANQYSFEISLVNGDSTTNVEDLALPAPRSTWQGYSEQVINQSGAALGVGWASATWTWDYMTAAQFAALRAIITTASATCWIRTMLDTGSYGYYTGIVNFPPPPYQQRAGRTQQIELRFVNLVAYTPTP